MRRLILPILFCLCTLPARAEESPAEDAPGILTRVVCYIPNRVLDFLDIIRLRAKVGPGLGAGVRVTDYTAFYAGSENSSWLGIPSERQAPWGRDQRHGLVLLGVDASDDLPHPPNYGTTEVGGSVHLVFVGVDAGIDLVELGDFFIGFFGLDPRGDDYPRPAIPPPPAYGSVLLPPLGFNDPNLVPKPEQFPSLTDRLSYIRDQGPHRVGRTIRRFDEQFSDEGEVPLAAPIIRDMQLAIYLRTLHGASQDVTVNPKLKLSIDLPNLERRFRLFIDTAYDDELPGRDISEIRDRGWSVGAGRTSARRQTYTDVGVHTRVPPKLFARTGWRPTWTWGKWVHRFDQRLFWESDDGFGTLTSQSIFRWVAPKWIVHSLTAGRVAERSTGYEWQQSLGIGYMGRLADETRREHFVNVGHTIHGTGLRASVFGSDDAFTQYRTVLTHRRSIHRNFIVLELAPGLQWREEQDWQIEYRFDVGLILFF
jgi:hypothetical protein